MIARMDIISINCPHTPATFHLLSARRLRTLPPHCSIVNTSRGEVIDDPPLPVDLRRVKSPAGLDVFEYEPAVNPRLRDLPNVVLLPHMGSATIEGRIDMGEKVLINIKTFADGHNPPDRMLPIPFDTIDQADEHRRTRGGSHSLCGKPDVFYAGL